MSRRPTQSSDPPPDVLEQIPIVRDRLRDWFRANRRDLPWRETRDPYRILVSEVMLQQTQVDRVIPYYRAFLERFSNVESLAAAPTAEVIRAWAGLGYNRRAVNLQRTAKHVVEQLDGIFPSSVDALMALPGVGPYTAGAIACFAFEQDVAFIDTNIRRVLHRIFFGVDVPSLQASVREIETVAVAIVPSGSGWEWNQALMEFGALQCTARKPACVICPLQSCCAAFPAIQTALAELPKGVRLKRESPYDGSNRYYRGRVIAALREHAAEDSLDLRVLGPMVRDDFADEHVTWLYQVVEGLARDGLAMVAEDSPVYDADGPPDALDKIRVRLP